ncbi:MAG: hypothetical protein DGJ47_000724 [Rickettsiaceae bacterium]
MLGQLLSGIGGAIGSYLGGGILSTVSKYAARRAGEYLNKKFFQRKKFFHKFTNVHDSFSIVKAEYGKPIPLVFGNMRVMGQIIWANRITEKRNIFNVSKYLRAQNTTINRQTTNLNYQASFAMALCEGEIQDIKRVWHHDELVDISNYKYRLYVGDEQQQPDPLIESESENQAVAYRGLAYIVFENLPLADFDDMIPNFSFEVTRKPKSNNSKSVEDLVESMVIIPGCGEYVYDTKIQSKQDKKSSSLSAASQINCHNEANIADSIYSLKQMQQVCENVKWVAPVVCWFGQSLNAGDCLIKPAVEFKDKNIAYSEDWKVGNYDRKSAYEIRKDEHDIPVYGGSVNDNSILRYLKKLRSSQLKIMFYPMFFMDVDKKPWRGRLTGSADQVRSFFTKKEGYNDFILHYANLVKNHVDAFIIGSELIGLTKVRRGNVFPAVEELVKLAKKVKIIMGPRVKISYAADWSEYHHTEGGWFNLDPLWSSKYIDFIGIDAYFPVTDTMSSNITHDELIKGWSQGEGYDYSINHETQEKMPLSEEYAWKNIRHWWENEHINPDSKKTPWVPRSKKIWFTEYGFPSIDKAANQPNIFFDPACVDGGVPRYSSGTVDFNVQRRSIRAFIKYWNTQEYVDQMFLWTWDARPYPAWPHMNVWNDGYLWEKGHWVNDKFGNSNLASIILEMSDRAGMNTESIDVALIDSPIEGMVFNSQISIINAINTLRTTYFFDINSCYSALLSFIKRGKGAEISIHEGDCIKINDNSFFEETEVPDSLKLSLINLFYLEKNHYEVLHKSFYNELTSNIMGESVNLPIILTENEAENIGEMILENIRVENGVIKFIVPSMLCKAKPGDFLELCCDGKSYTMRVINIELKNIGCQIIGVIDQRQVYFKPIISNNITYEHNKKEEYITEKLLLDLIPSSVKNQALSLVAEYQGFIDTVLYAKLAYDKTWSRVQRLSSTKSINAVSEIYQPNQPNIFLIDEASSIIIKSSSLKLSDNEWHQASWGKEVIYFKRIEKISEYYYRIFYFIRGAQGTHEFIENHMSGENFTLIGSGVNELSLSKKLYNQLVDFKCGKYFTSMFIEEPVDNNSVYLTFNKKVGNTLQLCWEYRDFEEDYWLISPSRDKYEYVIIIITEGGKEFEFKTLEKFIVIKNFDLSGDFKINIIVNII